MCMIIGRRVCVKRAYRHVPSHRLPEPHELPGLCAVHERDEWNEGILKPYSGCAQSMAPSRAMAAPPQPVSICNRSALTEPSQCASVDPEARGRPVMHHAHITALGGGKNGW
jgi:hypothetical protein